MTKVLLLHGINLNMFGKRDPSKYGTVTLTEIDAKLIALGRELGVEVVPFQPTREVESGDGVDQPVGNGKVAMVIKAEAWPLYTYAWAVGLRFSKDRSRKCICRMFM